MMTPDEWQKRFLEAQMELVGLISQRNLLGEAKSDRERAIEREIAELEQIGKQFVQQGLL